MSAYQSQREEDLKKINSIRKEYDLSKKEDLLAVYAKLQSGEISFQTDVGNRFDDTVYKRIQESQQAEEDKGDHKQAEHSETKKHGRRSRKVVVLTKKEMGIRRARLLIVGDGLSVDQTEQGLYTAEQIDGVLTEFLTEDTENAR